MIKETLEALRKFHEVALAQDGRLVESNVFREIKRNVLRRRAGRFLNELRRLLVNIKHMYLEKKLLENCSPDVVINLSVYLSFSMPFLTRIRKIPHIVFMDSPVVYETKTVDKDHLHFPLIPELIEKAVLKSCAAVITITNDLKSYLIKRYIIPEEKIHVIPNGVDINKFRPPVNGRKILSKYNLENKLVIGFSGAFKDWHNIDQLIEIMDHIIHQYETVYFLLVGEGPKKKDVENFIKISGTKNIILPGYVIPGEMPLYISAMDIALAPYKSQGDIFYGSPMKILEYMACGKPVVANRFGPIEEIIDHGRNGFLVEPGNDRLFLDNIVRLIENRDMRCRMGERARRTVVDRFTWIHRAKAISEVCNLVSKKYEATLV